jgi:hypothetical protein
MTTYLPNTKSVTDFVHYIRERLERSATAWREIAQAFAEAKDMYGGDSKLFKELCKETSFSKSSAHKLAAIASSERLAKYSGKLAHVHSWGTLYAITALSEEKFKVLCERYKLDEPDATAPCLTQAMVEAVRKEKPEKTSLKVYAMIYVDEEAMRAGLIEGEHLETLEEVLDTLQKTLPYVKITRTGVDEKVQSDYFDRVQRKMVELARKDFAKELKAIDNRLKPDKRSDETMKQCFTRAMCMSRDELWEMFETDRKGAFGYLGGDEYDEAALYNRAMDEMNKQDVKLADRVRQRTTPYKYANTIVRAEFSSPNAVLDGTPGGNDESNVKVA